MEENFETKEDFEKIVYQKVKEAGTTNVVNLLNDSNKFSLHITEKEKEKIGKIYRQQKPCKVGKILSKILSDENKYKCVEKNGQFNTWKYSIADSEIPEKAKVPAVNSAQQKVNQKNPQQSEKKDKISNVKTKSAGVNEISEPKKTNSLDEDPDSLPAGLEPIDETKSRIRNEIENCLIKVNENFYLSKYLVTQNLYEKITGENPSSHKDFGQKRWSEKWEGLPVENVSFEKALKFCNKLSEICGYEPCYESGELNSSKNGFRLPSEQEWKLAAFGGEKTSKYKYAGSDNYEAVAWFKNNTDETKNVGSKNPVELPSGEIFDLNGNVWEFCWTSDNAEKASCYGGSYKDGEACLELENPQDRIEIEKNAKKNNVGFRIAVNFKK